MINSVTIETERFGPIVGHRVIEVSMMFDGTPELVDAIHRAQGVTEAEGLRILADAIDRVTGATSSSSSVPPELASAPKKKAKKTGKRALDFSER